MPPTLVGYVLGVCRYSSYSVNILVGIQFEIKWNSKIFQTMKETYQGLVDVKY